VGRFRDMFMLLQKDLRCTAQKLFVLKVIIRILLVVLLVCHKTMACFGGVILEYRRVNKRSPKQFISPWHLVIVYRAEQKILAILLSSNGKIYVKIPILVSANQLLLFTYRASQNNFINICLVYLLNIWRNSMRCMSLLLAYLQNYCIQIILKSCIWSLTAVVVSCCVAQVTAVSHVVAAVIQTAEVNLHPYPAFRP